MSYCIGLDFGTESLRALLAETHTGREVAIKEFHYPHGVLDEYLPSDEDVKLESDCFLQHPSDYITALETTIPELLSGTGVDAKHIAGIGLDFTSCTLIPVDRKGTPLCLKTQYQNDPQAWVKLWKHHGAAREAEDIRQTAEERGEKFMDYFAHAISSEWLLPKVLETKRKSPTIYANAWTFVEACDWIPWLLTGRLVRNSCSAGFKAQHLPQLGGYPSPDFLEAVEKGFGPFFKEKMTGPVVPPGTCVGELTGDRARRLGLQPGIPVSTGMIDGHMALPGMGIVEPARMAIVLGTSFCHLMLGDRLVFGKGPLGMVPDGIVEGYCAYESGQSAGGDIYAWFVKNCAPQGAEYPDAGDTDKLHERLTSEAAALQPGQSGLLALDWWNGNRSILMDARLSGLIVGLTLNTRPAEIYRALIEATAFGTRKILQTYREDGIEVNDLIACGGMPQQNPFVVQLFADICKMSIKTPGTSNACALGAAMCGVAAAGKDRGGYASLAAAARSMAPPLKTGFKPDPDTEETYDMLYEEYRRLHDMFGLRERTMHRLRKIREMSAGQ